MPARWRTRFLLPGVPGACTRLWEQSHPGKEHLSGAVEGGVERSKAAGQGQFWLSVLGAWELEVMVGKV